MASKTSKKLGIVVSIVAIALCVVLITGSTFSLFTGETNADITISAGEVKLTADIDDNTFALSSLGVAQPGTTFANGGTATLSGADLTLENVTPGDKAEFDIVVDNDSTVLIQYRITWTITGELAQYLVTNVDNGTSQWAEWAPITGAENTKTHHVSIELPKEVNNDAFNDSAEITFYLEAVQANATGLYSSDAYVSTADGLQAALDAGATEIHFNNDIEINQAIVIPAAAEEATPSNPGVQGRKRAASETTEGVVFYMNGYSLTGKGEGEVIVNNGTLTIVEGSIVSEATEGAAIVNNGAIAIVESEIKLAPAGVVESSVTAIENTGTMSFIDSTVTDEEGVVVVYENLAEEVNESGYVIRTDSTTGEVIFYDLLADVVATEVVIPEGVTTIDSYAFASNKSVEKITLASTVTTLADRAFRDTSASVVVLNEGLTNISYQAFRNALNVTEVVIPSTVKTISKEAFQNSGITTLTVPATVTTIEYGAMRDMKMLETVTLEGNADIPVYAFRACTNLKTVYINGDDVTFGNGGASRGMIFTNKENGDGSAMTIYVKNETVKARLLAQDTAAKDYGGYTIVCPITVTTADELLEALANAQPGAFIDATGVTLTVGSDKLIVPAGITLKGATIAMESQNYVMVDGNAADGIVVFEECTFRGADFGMFVIGAADADAPDMEFNNCEFYGQIAPNFYSKPDGVSTFNNCFFGLGSGNIGFVNCMGGTHYFNSCKFDYTGGATHGSNQYVRWNSVHAYSERYTTKVILDGCTRINCGTSKFETVSGNSSLTVK